MQADASLHQRQQDAEQALLGSVLLNDALMDRDELELLDAVHFQVPVHGLIWSSMRAAKNRGEAIDPITIAPYVEGSPDLSGHGGGLSYLASLAGGVTTSIRADEYARVIRQAALRRKLVDAVESIRAIALSPDAERSIEEDLSEAERLIASVSDSMVHVDRMVELRDALDRALAQAEAASKAEGRITGVTTGLLDLDSALGGLHGSDLVVLAGRPAMGKTALAANIARAAAVHNQPVGFFSLEMSADQLGMRLLAEDTGITTERIRSGRVSHMDLGKLGIARSNLAGLPFHIDDTPAAAVAQLRLRARRLKRTSGLGLIVVDYIQLIQGHEKVENRVQEVSRITRDLKLMAKEFHVPVLALSQLSRNLENREDKRPILADLRESGSIEQDADVVLMLYRAEVYTAKEEPRPKDDDTGSVRHAEAHARWSRRMEDEANKAEIIVAKNRHGPTRTVHVRFDGERTRFENLARN